MSSICFRIWKVLSPHANPGSSEWYFVCISLIVAYLTDMGREICNLVSLGFSSCFGILPVDYTSTQLQLVLVLGPSSILSPDIDFCSHSPMRSHLVLSPSFSHSRPLTDKSAFILHWDWEWLGLLSCCTSLCLTLLFNMIDGTGTFTKWSPFSST